MAIIIEYRVHPAVGIARMGNSQTNYFLTDEKPWFPIDPVQKTIPQAVGNAGPNGSVRDGANNLCKQGARFRVFGYEIEEQPGNNQKSRKLLRVWECTSATHDLEWTVTVANLKSSTDPADYLTKKAGNTPDPITLRSTTAAHRNRQVFTGKPAGRLDLGSCFLDTDGRMTVLGSDGEVKRFNGARAPDDPQNLYWLGWEDDAADGTVTAKVTPKANSGKPDAGKPRDDAIGGWVVINMPDYGADAQAPVDLYALAQNHALSRLFGPAPVGDAPVNQKALLTYYQLIKPLQFSQYGVPYTITKYDGGHAPKHSARVPMNITYSKANGGFKAFLRPARKTRGNIPENIWTGTRPNPVYPYQSIGNRAPPPPNPPPPANPLTPNSMPDLNYVAMTEIQSHGVQQWAAGTLAKGSDTVEKGNNPAHIPYQLDRAHMESLSGGSFYPGIEVSRVAHFPNVWQGRIGCHENHYDVRVTNTVDDAGKITGPAQPGYLTRDLACPWHADFYACDDPWWPHSRPISVQVAARAVGGWKAFMSNAAGGFTSYGAHVGNAVTGGLAEHWWKLGFVRYDFNSQELIEKDREPAFGISNAPPP